MTKLELKEWIASIVDDIEFYYRGKRGSVCPFSANDFFDNVDDLMAARVICGKSLNEIFTELDFW